MEYIKGITYGAFAGAGEFTKKQAYTSIDKLIERTGANYIILVPNGLQDTPQSQEIDYTSPANLTDEELLKALEEYCEKINKFYGRDFGITRDDFVFTRAETFLTEL